MFQLKTESGNFSKTVIFGWLQILSAALLVIAEFVKTGDFTPYAVILLAQGLLTLYLRSITSEPLA